MSNYTSIVVSAYKQPLSERVFRVFNFRKLAISPTRPNPTLGLVTRVQTPH